MTPWTVACQAPLPMGFSQARISERVAIAFSRGTSRRRDRTQVSCISCTGRQILYHWATEGSRVIMWNAGLHEAQAGSKIAGRNINNLRYADDTTPMAESEEELKSCLTKVKEESEKVGLKLNIQKPKIMASGPTTSWQIDGEAIETVTDFCLPGLQNHCRWWLQSWN